MPINKKTDKCPKGGMFAAKPKSKKCQKCDFYNHQQWYNYDGLVETFCTYDLTPETRDILKKSKVKKK